MSEENKKLEVSNEQEPYPAPGPIPITAIVSLIGAFIAGNIGDPSSYIQIGNTEFSYVQSFPLFFLILILSLVTLATRRARFLSNSPDRKVAIVTCFISLFMIILPFCIPGFSIIHE